MVRQPVGFEATEIIQLGFYRYRLEKSCCQVGLKNGRLLPNVSENKTGDSDAIRIPFAVSITKLFEKAVGSMSVAGSFTFLYVGQYEKKLLHKKLRLDQSRQEPKAASGSSVSSEQVPFLH